MNNNVVSFSEFQKRKEQLEDLRRRAFDAGDLRSELAAIQEINKLCGLYNEQFDDSGDSVSVLYARQHLESLNVAPPGLPLEELARRVSVAFSRLPPVEDKQDKSCQTRRTKSKRITQGNKAR